MKTLIIVLLLAVLCHSQEKNAKKNDGRFQIVSVVGNMMTTYMIDTHTGKLWKPVCAQFSKDKICLYEYWQAEDVMDINVTRKELFKNIEAVVKASEKEQK